MPNKKCPKCDKLLHVRKHKCDCGHDFHPIVITEPNVEVTVHVKSNEITEDKWKEAHEHLGYTVRIIAPKEKIFNKKYAVTKTLKSGKKATAVFNKDNGMVTGICVSVQ